jgi:hypothetical protein
MNWLNFVANSEDANTVPTEWLMERIRNWRNVTLTACDHTQLEDSPLDATKKGDWKRYRKELRDLPQQGADPRLWVFPTRPA